MNISELNQALNAIADEVTDDPGTRLASVTRRVRTARRSKVAGTIVTTCAAVTAFVLLPNLGVLPESDSPSASSSAPFGSLATTRDGRLLTYTDAGGVKLLGETVGVRGAHSVSLSVTPKSGNIGWTQLCAASEPGVLRYRLTVNGKYVPSAALESLRYTGAATLNRPNSTCDAANPPMQVQRLLSSSPTGNVHAWRAFHIQPGVPAIFRLSVTSTDDAAGRAALARATLQLGVFEIPRHPARSRGVWIERHIVDPAAARGAFVLVHRKFTRIGPGRHALTVPVPADGQQIYVRTFVVRGEGSGITLKPGPRTHNELQSAVGPWSVEKSIDSGPSTVRVALATVPRGVERRVGMLVYVRYE